MMLDYLPEFVLKTISNYSLAYITEIRLRVDKPLSLQYRGRYIKLEYYGNKKLSAVDLENIILTLTKRSIYAFNENIKKGYITGYGGERIGISGACVYDDFGQIKTIKDFTSICIRMPHEILGCANKVADICFKDGVKNLLIISPPGGGKTTLLRDLVRLISDTFEKNILVVDEKCEISGSGVFDIGVTTDVLLNAKKAFGFGLGILNLRPDVIVSDELFSDEDIGGATKAMLSGVKLLASVHAESIRELELKPGFARLLNDKLFDYAVILSCDNLPGEIKEIVRL